MIHRYQPAAFLVALYFMPIAATVDKKSDSSPSSFARTVAHLRARTGRIDPTLPSQADHVDIAAIALYSPCDEEVIGSFAYRDELPRGVVRYFLDNLVRRNSRLAQAAIAGARLACDAGLFPLLVPFHFLFFERES